MPDLDIISRHLRRGWRKPMRLLLRTADPPEAAARATVQALTATLREQGGLPGFEEFCELLKDRLAGRLDAHSAYTRADAIEHRHQHHRHVKVAGVAADRTLCDINHGERLSGGVEEEFALRCCREMIDHNLLSYVRPESVGKHYPGPAQAELRERECLALLREPLRTVARQLIADPSGRGARAPALRTYRKRSTSELLRERIL